MDRKEERRIIELAVAGDRSAAGDLIRAHQRSVYAYLLRMSGRPDVAEDIVQEAFVRVLTSLERFDFRFRFSTWLFTIARRLYLNHVQKMKPMYDSDTVGHAMGSGGEPVGPTADNELRGVRRAAIDDALQELTTDQREVIVLFHQLDWPIALIAEHLGMPEGTVKSHLHRGRRRMREVLSGQPRVIAKMDLADANAVAVASAVQGASGRVA
jgi:RNA polymerase sigma-70 factor (ECF subfamily)